jgi:hypothetical protein
MNVNLTTPAFPCTPINDQYNRLVVPNAGINKLEYFALEIFKVYFEKREYIEISKMNHDTNGSTIYEGYRDVIMDYCINDAITFLTKIQDKTKPTENEKTSKLVTL